eukprot:TRINITY_DN1057_c0_g1_i2.p2 TRINITY_DN1057_c0_g1~~TRINITY_DN1057_c0_g1_i2.p2  ORF type:complete len:273 (+),score=99.23 TRINITY_DN1057_c0_g1_i2:59-820(+)
MTAFLTALVAAVSATTPTPMHMHTTPSPHTPSTPAPHTHPSPTADNNAKCMMFKTEDDCLNCVSMSSGAMCHLDGKSYSNHAEMMQDPCMASGRECVACHWMGGMCMASAATPTMDHSMHSMGGHSMSMVFTSTQRVLILFEDLETTNGGEYFAAMLVIFIISAVTGVLRYYATVVSRGQLPVAARGVLICIVFTLVYALMLVTMTMNVGLYFSVIFGLTLAWVITEIWDESRRSSVSPETCPNKDAEPVDCH